MSAGLLPPVARRLAGLMAAAMVVLTLADAAITIVSLDSGGVELNAVVRDGSGGLHVGMLTAINVFVLVPLWMAFVHALRHAQTVPAEVLEHWYRHPFNVFVHPRSAEGRARAPLRFAAAAMLIVVLKIVIVTSNVLALTGLPSPATAAVELLMARGHTVEGAWRIFYAFMLLPSYIVAVGLAALSLRHVQHMLPSLPEAKPA